MGEVGVRARGEVGVELGGEGREGRGEVGEVGVRARGEVDAAIKVGVGTIQVWGVRAREKWRPRRSGRPRQSGRPRRYSTVCGQIRLT